MISPPSSIVFSIGGFHLHYYGVIMFIAILSAIGVVNLISKKFVKDVDTNVLLDIWPVLILCAILGARLYYVILDFPYYSKHLSEITAVWNGGMSIHGAIIGGVLGGIFLARKYRFDFLKYADVISFGLLLGQAVGRFGNYFNCEAFGAPTNLPWKLFIPVAHRPLDYINFSYFHPAFLYESLWNLTVFAFLFFVMIKCKNLANGSIFFAYLLLYSIGRFLIEFLRLDSVLNVGAVPIAQIVCIITALLSVSALLYLNYRKKRCTKTSL